MKTFTNLIVVLLGLTLGLPEASARGHFGGGNKAAQRGGGKARVQRSPMTNSRVKQSRFQQKPKQISRPAQRPQVQRPQVTKPAQRPQVQRPQATKPAQRPQVQRPQVTKPAQRPQVTKPAQRPQVTRPAQRPSVNPGQRPSTRPGTLPGNRPNNRPGQGIGNRPSTLPGMVSYPNRPNTGNKRVGNNRIGSDRVGNNRIGNNRGNTYIKNVNVGGHNKGLNRPSTLPANNRNWNRNHWGGNSGIWGNNVNININNNFRQNNNFAYRPNYWGGRPWWGANNYHHWHHGHWGYGWNSSYYRSCWYYDDDDFARGFMWGIAAWSLGNMIFDMGYKSYQNPYKAPPVQNTYVTYTQPMSVAAAANPPGDEAAAKTAEASSEEALERSRVAFRNRDYMAASKAIDEALGHTPDDVTLHEFRALIFFALGKYSDAAGVLNSVLASGPGWSWDTMNGFYESSSTYDEQLRKLEDYVKGTPESPEGHFLLGYHYMVCGKMVESHTQFARTVELQPADSVARDLAALTEASIPDDETGKEIPPPPPAPEPVPIEKLVGTWTSKSSTGGTITFTMKESGDYLWQYREGETDSTLEGTYGLDDKGLLVLTSNDSQMVSEIIMKGDSGMHFGIVGAPTGDPGLDFTKG